MTYLRTVPPIASPNLPAKLAAAAPASHNEGGNIADARGKMVFEGARASCHDWTGKREISPTATLTGARAVNDPSAINVTQILILGTKRRAPSGAVSMPPFGDAYSDGEMRPSLIT